MRQYILRLPLLGAMVLLSSCIDIGDFGDSYAFRQDFHSTHALEPGGRVSVESFNGPIEVVGWDQNSVEVNGTKHASFREALNDIKVDVDATAGAVRIHASRSDGFHHGGVRFSIRVPRKTILELIASSNGRIDVDGVEGNVRLRTSNGGIRVQRLKGDLEAETSNGTIETQDLSGNANVHTSNGAVRGDASAGSFQAVTSNGRIEVRLIDPAASGPVRLHSSNGHIELSLDGKQLPEVRASTSNSSILLRLPATASARVRAYTSHSPVTSEFDGLRPDFERHRTRSELEGTIGHGGPLIDLESSNGSIKIEKL